LDSDRKQCPFCTKWVTVRKDGKIAKHRHTDRMRRGGSPCIGSEVDFDEARELKRAGRKPGEDVDPEAIF